MKMGRSTCRRARQVAPSIVVRPSPQCPRLESFTNSGLRRNRSHSRKSARTYGAPCTENAPGLAEIETNDIPVLLHQRVQKSVRVNMPVTGVEPVPRPTARAGGGRAIICQPAVPMTNGSIDWLYALAPDIEVAADEVGILFRSRTDQVYLEGLGYRVLANVLTGGGATGADLADKLHRAGANAAMVPWEALLFRLDQRGLLVRRLRAHGRTLVSCVPCRPPPVRPSASGLDGTLVLAPGAIARADGKEICLEVPGSWARIIIHDGTMLALLHDLAAGCSPRQIAATSHAPATIMEVLTLMDRCGLLSRGKPHGLSTHDLLFHARTRRGYARTRLGKAGANTSADTAPPAALVHQGAVQPLQPPVIARLVANDPPFALVSEQRRSVRLHGTRPLTVEQLSEFLFRTLHERRGRRPYPSGGSCYPLTAYLAVARCVDLGPGVYAYDPKAHALVAAAPAGPGMDRLLEEAAGTAGVRETPQILLLLAAHFATMSHSYGDLSYSLILKEVGAVFQAAMMAAAAMGIGSCPLGSGNSIAFAALIGRNPCVEATVGEMILGSLDDNEMSPSAVQ